MMEPEWSKSATRLNEEIINGIERRKRTKYVQAKKGRSDENAIGG